MTVRPIVYELSVDGADRTQAQFNGVAAAEGRASTAFGALRQGVRDGSQAFSALGSVVGNLSPQLGHAVSAIGQIGNAFTALTAASGPVGIAITVITTAISVLAPLMSDAADDSDRLSEGIRNVGEAAADVAPSVTAYRETVQRLHEEELRVGRTGFTESARSRQLEADRQAIHEAESARQEFLDAAGVQDGERLEAEQAADEEAHQRQIQEEIAFQNARTEAGRRAAAENQEILQRSLQEDIEFAAAEQAERERLELQGQEQRNAIFRQEQENRARLNAQRIEQEQALQEQLNTIQQQEHENQIRRIEQQRQAHQRLSQEIQGYAQPLVSGFVGAMSKVIAGTESAGDAFKGLLSSFLEFISQQAALKAAFEFAESLVSLATFNYGGAALHAAAGAAFTAVAIAAGAGAIATAPSAAPAAPAANQAPQQAGPSNTTIIWNSPVITAQDRSELGRSLTQLTSRSDARFASSV